MGPCVRRDDDSGAFAPDSDSKIKRPNHSTHTFAFSRRDAPELCMNIRPEREGVGNAGCLCTRSRAWCVVNTRVSHHGYTGSPGIPARNGFNGFLRALLGDRALLSPSPARRIRPLGLTSPSANLTPASRRQDHTTSPSATTPLVRAKCLRYVVSRPSPPAPNVRDDREAPLFRGGICWMYCCFYQS